jgi:hypothetical protein
VTDEVFYVDEADIDLNPRLGPAWTPRGVQAAIPTPGRNRKRYVAGALNARTGRVIWVEHSAKNSELFLRLMDALSSAYRRARRLYVILDKNLDALMNAVRRFMQVCQPFPGNQPALASAA